MVAGWSARWPFRRRPRIYLHIGSSKTGTTYLQALMEANRERLSRAGVLCPEDRVRAVREVMVATRRSHADTHAAPTWDRLCGLVLAHRGKAAVISMEYLSFADAERAAKVVGSFGDADVHVILTVRDATYTVPGQWQTSCRNGGRVPYPDYVRAMRRSLKSSPVRRGRAYRIFQRAQGIPRMIDVWRPLVPAGNFHVVTVPPKGSDPMLLWRRFAKVIGVRPGVCKVQPSQSNPSLGYASTELIRRVNLELGEIDRPGYFRVVRHHLARRILEPHAKQERPLALDATGVRLARRWNRRVRRAIAESGVQVIGALADLPVGPPQQTPPDFVPPPSDDELLAAAETARTGLLTLITDLEAGNTMDGAPDAHAAYDEEAFDGSDDVRTGPAAEVDGGGEGRDAVDSAVVELAELVRKCIELSRPSGEVSAAEPS